MKKSLSLFILLSLLGCSGNLTDNQSSIPYSSTVQTRSVSSAEADKAQRFTEKMLDSLIKVSPFKGKHTVITDNKVRSNIAPSLYVVNFDEGGWMIVAGHVRNENQVLAYSETGSFNPSEISNQGVRLWYDLTKAQMEDVEIDPEQEQSPESAEAAVSSTNFVIDSQQEYYWVRLPLPATTIATDQGYVDSLLVTKWGQGDPWNIKTPSPSGAFCHTGCVAVSCAQILYYLKKTKNFSIGLYDVSGTYASSYSTDGEYYYISSINRTNYQPDSDKWDKMKISENDNRYGVTNVPVAELMFDIAEHAGMQFYSFGSGTTISTTLFGHYNVICDESDYDFATVRRSLDAGMPVEISCYQTSRRGHSWVIDGYQVNETRTDRAYQWKLIPPDSLQYYNNLDYDYVLTESQKQFSYPDVEENQIEHNYSYRTDNYLTMNWGWDGDYDNGHYSINPDWTVSNYRFWRDAKIIHNFRQ